MPADRLPVAIAGRPIGPEHPPYVVCELSANHNGRLDRALALIDAAAATGCDAIKIQTYTADTLTIASDRPEFRIAGGLWDGRTLHDLYSEAFTPYDWHPALFARAAEHGVTLFSTPFDQSAIDLLESLDCPAYKIASFELVDLPLVRAIARLGKPVILSTGMASEAEIRQAVQTLRDNGDPPLVLLHCISAYPAPMDQANVRTVPDLAARFGVVAGLSDHTPGTVASVAAVALGASVIEKHFTLSRDDGGPDSGFSLEPQEFRQLVHDCRAAWQALGTPGYDLKGSERQNITFRRSLYVVADIAAGEALTEQNIRSIRPGHGLAPRHLDEVIGKIASRDLKAGEPLAWDMVV